MRCQRHCIALTSCLGFSFESTLDQYTCTGLGDLGFAVSMGDRFVQSFAKTSSVVSDITTTPGSTVPEITIALLTNVPVPNAPTTTISSTNEEPAATGAGPLVNVQAVTFTIYSIDILYYIMKIKVCYGNPDSIIFKKPGSSTSRRERPARIKMYSEQTTLQTHLRALIIGS